MRRSILICATLLAPLTVLAHGGEDHTKSPASERAPSRDARTVYAETERFELVLKYPARPHGEPLPFQVLLTDWATNRPIADATVSLEFSGPATAASTARASTTAGVYRAEVAFPSEGRYTLLATVTAAGQSDLLAIDDVRVGPPEPEPGRARSSRSRGSSWLWAGLAAVLAIAVAGSGIALRSRLRSRRRRAAIRAAAGAPPPLPPGEGVGG
jgi:hypothetical protein